MIGSALQILNVRICDRNFERDCDFANPPYDFNGNLLKSYQMDNGTGIEYIFHDNGKLKTENTWKGGVLDGVVKTYDEKGDLISTVIYSNGVKLDDK